MRAGCTLARASAGATHADVLLRVTAVVCGAVGGCERPTNLGSALVAVRCTSPALHEPVDSLVDMLKHRCTKLDLHGAHLGISGAIRLAQAMDSNDTVASISVAGNEIADAGARRLSEALLNNKEAVVTALDISCALRRVACATSGEHPSHRAMPLASDRAPAATLPQPTGSLRQGWRQ